MLVVADDRVEHEGMLFVLIVNATAASEGQRRKSMELHYGNALASITAEERVQSHTPSQYFGR